MHSERDVNAEQSFQTVLRENARLAYEKAKAVDDANSQVYINVFTRKSRLSCFSGLTELPKTKSE